MEAKISLILVETVFWLVETYFLTSSSFLLVETDFLSSENSILSCKGLLKFLKFGGSTFFKRNLMLVETDFLTSGSFSFFQILLLMKAIFRLVETYF